VVKSANEIETMLEPLARRNLALHKASVAGSRTNGRVGMAVTRAHPELARMSSSEIEAWAAGVAPFSIGADIVSGAVRRLSNTDVVGVFVDWLMPQVEGDCIPFELAFAAYLAFCDRFGVRERMKRRYFVQTMEFMCGPRGWVVPRSATTGAPKSLNVYGWMVLPEPYLDALVAMQRRDGWLSQSTASELERLVRWYPSQVTKPEFSATGGFFRKEAHAFCVEHVCTPRRWIRDNVLSDIEEPDDSDLPKWKQDRLAEKWHAQMTEAIAASYGKFRDAYGKWARDSLVCDE
jgi:hypothetical protein